MVNLFTSVSNKKRSAIKQSSKLSMYLHVSDVRYNAILKTFLNRFVVDLAEDRYLASYIGR